MAQALRAAWLTGVARPAALWQAGDLRCRIPGSSSGADRASAAQGPVSLGWADSGLGIRRQRSRGVARAAQARNLFTASTHLVREYGSGIRAEGGRRDWPVFESAAERTGAERG